MMNVRGSPASDRAQFRLELRRVEARRERAVDVELHLRDRAARVVARHPAQRQAVRGDDADEVARRWRREAVVEQCELRQVRGQDVDAVRADEVAVGTSRRAGVPAAGDERDRRARLPFSKVAGTTFESPVVFARTSSSGDEKE